MKKISILLVISLFSFWGIKAQDTVLMYHNGNVIYQNDVTKVSNFKMTDNTSNLLINEQENNVTLPINSIDSIVFSNQGASYSNIIYVTYSDDTAYIVNNVQSEDIEITVSGADVSILTNAGLTNIEYYLSGTSSNGSFYLESDKKFELSLGGLELTSLSTIPIRLKKNKTTTINVVDGTTNVLTDNSASDGKAVINTKGETTFIGTGTLTCIANKKNGISSDNTLTFEEPTVNIAINADEGKGIKSDDCINVTGGNINIEALGTVVLEQAGSGYAPSYCSAMGADSNITISGGNITIEIPSSNHGGRGIKADGDIIITGTPVIDITSASDGATYTDSTGTTDSYTSSCIKADGNLVITGGDITIAASGLGGKGINIDGTIIIMESEETTPNINVSATGEHFVETQGYGWGSETDYAQPKGIKSKSNFYIFGGNINVYTENDGGEGLESKDTMFISGGEIVLNTYDDAINAANHIEITGGKIYAHATGNDAIDCNGTMTISGGLIIAIGQTAPEGGFDCDQNQFKITGGTLIGIGGEHSTPTSSVCTQRVFMKRNTVSSGQAINITDNSGNSLCMFQIPTITSNQGQGGGPGGGGFFKSQGNDSPNYGPGGPGGGGPGGNNGLVLLFSSPNLSTGTYKIYNGGSIEGGTEWNGYYENATYTGTNYSSITISSMVTSN
ncbi:MAG: carbohydrate-binding domain-containing protein [Bacteroidales bacterium]|nr:carbohydrate-binding domain-containing protein [Bacteroidales bacterium]